MQWAAVLGSAFHRAPLLTVLGCFLLALVVGGALFIRLNRQSDPPRTHSDIALEVGIVMTIALIGSLVIWVAYCSCVIE